MSDLLRNLGCGGSMIHSSMKTGDKKIGDNKYPYSFQTTS